MGTYQKMVNGRLRTFTSYLYSIPLEFSFTLEFQAENMTTAFKIDQAVRDFFYKNHTFRFNYKGTVCSARAGFPESGIQIAGTQYTMGQSSPENRFIKLSYPIAVETYQPSWDRYNERPADNTIKAVGVNIYVNEKVDGNEPDGLRDGRRDKSIEWLTKFKDRTLAAGTENLIEWTWKYSDNDLLKVDIAYQEEGNEREYPIAMNEDNHEFYYWDIPRDFTANPHMDVTFTENDYASVITDPEVVIWPDALTRIITPENVYVRKKGFFSTSEPDNIVEATIEYLDREGRIVENIADAPLKNYMLDSEGTPLQFECIVYEGEMNPRKIRLIVRDHNDDDIQAVTDWFWVV